MKQDDFISSLDGLIVAIETVLTKNRSSLSIDDILLLESVINTLQKLKKVKVVSREEVFLKTLPMIMRVFQNPEVFEKIKDFLDGLF